MRKLLLTLLFVPLLLSCAEQEKVQCPQYIAHAGGAIDSCIYTNSLEALELAVANGYRFIEFDFNFTSDSVLIASHSWEEFNAMTGCSHKRDTAPTYGEFIRRRIHGRYTPLSAEEINRFFLSHPNLFLVTDKVSSPQVLGEYFPELKQRMVVEAFSYPHYTQLKEQGYYRVLYSCMAQDLSSTLVKHLFFNKFTSGEKIEWIALHTSGFNNSMFKFLNITCRFNVALFTVDHQDSIPLKHRDRVGMIYTNYLLP